MRTSIWGTADSAPRLSDASEFLWLDGANAADKIQPHRRDAFNTPGDFYVRFTSSPAIPGCPLGDPESVRSDGSRRERRAPSFRTVNALQRWPHDRAGSARRWSRRGGRICEGLKSSPLPQLKFRRQRSNSGRLSGILAPREISAARIWPCGGAFCNRDHRPHPNAQPRPPCRGRVISL